MKRARAFVFDRLRLTRSGVRFHYLIDGAECSSFSATRAAPPTEDLEEQGQVDPFGTRGAKLKWPRGPARPAASRNPTRGNALSRPATAPESSAVMTRAASGRAAGLRHVICTYPLP